jgi:hypothetical protein
MIARECARIGELNFFQIRGRKEVPVKRKHDLEALLGGLQGRRQTVKFTFLYVNFTFQSI